jgi:hypothetical protein
MKVIPTTESGKLHLVKYSNILKDEMDGVYITHGRNGNGIQNCSSTTRREDTTLCDLNIDERIIIRQILRK